MRNFLAASAAIAVATAATAATVTNNFDSAGDVTLSPTQAAGTWYTDRYAPATFASGATGGSRTGVLHHGLSANDNAAGRPGSFSGGFYDTQGRKYDVGLTGAVQRLAIELFVDATSSASVEAGIWGVGENSGGAVSAYPIIAYIQNTVNATSGAGFYFWNGAAYVAVDTSIGTNTWNDLEIVLTVGTGFEAFLNGNSVFTLADVATTSLDQVILNSKNFGADQDVYWDNFVASDDGTVIPLPTAGALGMAGVLVLGARRRRLA